MITLNIGDKAPNFEALDQDGNLIKSSDLLGKKVVLYFYPKDSTPGCTMQACNLRDNYEELQKENYSILGISSDSARRHQNFIKKNELPFPLLVDEDLTVHNLFGTWQEKKNFGKVYMGTVRTTFVINEEGIIEDIIKKVKTKLHHEQILKKENAS